MTELLTGWNELILAFALFFLSHIIPVRPTIREWLIRHIGKALYLAAYSVLSIILFVWLIVAVGRAPYLALVAIRSLAVMDPKCRYALRLFAAGVRHGRTKSAIDRISQ